MAPAAALPGTGSVVSLVIVLLTLWLVRRSRGPTLALRWRSWLADILLGIVAGAVVWAIFRFAIDPIAESLFGAIKLDDFSNVRGNLGNYLILLAIGLIYGGIAEELVFRGYVIGWGSSLLGDRWAVPLVLLSSAVFGFTHLYQGGAGVLSTGLTGLTFGLIYLMCGRRLLPAIVTHMTVDAIGITEIYLGLLR